MSTFYLYVAAAEATAVVSVSTVALDVASAFAVTTAEAMAEAASMAEVAAEAQV